VLVYAQQQGAKADAARLILAEGGMISVQVINEFANVSRKKLNRSWAEIEAAIADVLALVEPPLPLTLAMSEEARRLSAEHGVSFYDAMVVAAAQHAACTVLLTEDLQAGRNFGGLTVVNPFVTPPSPPQSAPSSSA